jgi:hypothetical protein
VVGRWSAVLSSAVALGATVCLTAAPAVGAAKSPGRTIVTTAVANYDTKCLDVTGDSKSKGAPLQQWTCRNAALQQRWFIDAHAYSGGKFIKSYSSGMCLSIANNDRHAGGHVIQWPCNAKDPFESWRMHLFPGTTYYYTIQNVGSGYYMHPAGNRTGNGVKIYVDALGGTPPGVPPQFVWMAFATSGG